jgi:hypothetical protein
VIILMWKWDYLDTLTERYKIVHRLLPNRLVIDLCAGNGGMGEFYKYYVWCDIISDNPRVLIVPDDRFTEVVLNVGNIVKLWLDNAILTTFWYAWLKWVNNLENDIIREAELKVESSTLDDSIDRLIDGVWYFVIEWTKTYVEWWMKHNKRKWIYKKEWDNELWTLDRVMYIFKT